MRPARLRLARLRPARLRPARRISRTLVVMGLAVSLLGLTAPAGADPAERKREVERGITDLREDLEGTSAELQAAHQTLEATQARLPPAQAELAQAQDTRAQAQRRDAELAGRLTAAQDAEALAQDDLTRGERDITTTQATIGQVASRAYRGAGVAPELALVLDAGSPEEFARRYVLVDTALRSQNGALGRLRQQQAQQANAQARLIAVRGQVQLLRGEAAANLRVAQEAEATATARQEEIQQLVAAQQQAVAVVEASRAEEMARLDQLEAERASLEAELTRLAEIARAEAEAAARAAAAARASRSRPPSGEASSVEAPAPTSDGVLARPVSAPVTSGYGWRTHPIYGDRRLHAGTDFGAACGTPVRAAEGGTVVRAGSAGGYGNQVVLNHGVLRGQGVATSYNHLSRLAVTSGAVSRGEVVGYVGTTGTSTGCHLHFEVYVDGSTVDPMGWL